MLVRVAYKKGVKRVTIDPGEYFVSREPVVISTLLGSCVSACLYDPLHQVVGMNHFLLAQKRHTTGPVLHSEAGRYGIHAMELLVNRMLSKGAQARNIKAKVFGGGDVLGHSGKGCEDFFMVGALNSEFVIEFLRNENIPLVASDLRGDYGRVVHFNSPGFSAYMKRISDQHETALIDTEQRYIRQKLQDQAVQDQAPAIEFW